MWLIPPNKLKPPFYCKSPFYIFWTRRKNRAIWRQRGIFNSNSVTFPDFSNCFTINSTLIWTIYKLFFPISHLIQKNFENATKTKKKIILLFPYNQNPKNFPRNKCYSLLDSFIYFFLSSFLSFFASAKNCALLFC